MRQRNKRHITLLEVLIAFALIVMCAIPLIYPHTYILTVQREFINEVKLDNFVNNDYVIFLEQLYKNEIEWEDLFKPTELKTDLPYKGVRLLTEKKHKPKITRKDYVGESLHLFEITYTFTPSDEKKKPLTYTYNLTIMRKIPKDIAETLPEEEDA